MMIKRNSLLLILASLSSQLWASNNVIEPPMVTIPAGDFLMGGEKGSENELPIHKVNIKSFKMSQYEVTVKEYQQFIDATGYSPSGEGGDNCMRWQGKEAVQAGGFGIELVKGSWNTPAYAPSEYHPVVCVSSIDIQAYIDWLSKKSGKKYRLPSEAEWEYAARGGRTSRYFFGENEADLCKFGNVFDMSGLTAFTEQHGLSGAFAQCDDKAEYTTVIGMYQPNAFGLYDMIGNVGEILADCEHANYQDAPQDGSPWTEQCSSYGPLAKMTVHRGGAYGLWSPPEKLTSTARSHIAPDLHSSLGEGFRLVLDATKNSIEKPSLSTQQFLQELREAQSKEQARRQKLIDFPAQPDLLSLEENKPHRSVRLSWKKSSEAEVLGYNVYRSNSFEGDYTQIASNILTTEFVDDTPPTRKHSYVITTVNQRGNSIYSRPLTTSDTVTFIPGTVQAEDFNQMQNIMVGVINEDEDTDEGYNLTGPEGILKGSWTEYSVKVNKSGIYQIHYRVASADGSDGFELLINDEVKMNLPIPKTGGWRKWQTETGQKIHLSAGQHTIRIKAIANGWKINWFSLEPLTSK